MAKPVSNWISVLETATLQFPIDVWSATIREEIEEACKILSEQYQGSEFKIVRWHSNEEKYQIGIKAKIPLRKAMEIIGEMRSLLDFSEKPNGKVTEVEPNNPIIEVGLIKA